MNKRGVSPVIATVLLIAIVIVIAAIIFIWASGFLSERAQKSGRAVELSCPEISFTAGYDGPDASGNKKVGVINRGNVPIYAFNVKEVGDGEVLVYKNLGSTITQGDTAQVEIPSHISGEILMVPVILGESSSGKVEFPCPDEFGYEVLV